MLKFLQRLSGTTLGSFLAVCLAWVLEITDKEGSL